jgi:hypothetical protein
LYTASTVAVSSSSKAAAACSTGEGVLQAAEIGGGVSQIATDTGVGRATLYKYLCDVESILVAWHERQIEAHLDRLTEVSGQRWQSRGSASGSSRGVRRAVPRARR